MIKIILNMSNITDSKKRKYSDYESSDYSSDGTTTPPSEDSNPKQRILRKKRRIDYSEFNDVDLDKIYEDESDGLKPMVNKVVKSANQKAPVDTSWKTNLTKDEIQELEPVYKKILDEFKKKDINELDIMRASMSLEDKIMSYELLRVIRNELNNQGETDTWLKMRIKLYDKIKRHTHLTDEDQEVLKRLDKINKTNHSIRHKIIRSKHPDTIKAAVYQKYCEIKDLKKDDEYHCKTVEWINKILNLPTENIKMDSLYRSSIDLIYKVYNQMNIDLYGQVAAKEKIIDILSAMWVNPQGSNRSVVLVGPPGVGKTVFARSLSRSTKLPFYQISFGGAKDSSVLKGHGFTYLGAKPGEIVEALIKMKAKNGILFLDELDKIDESSTEGKQVADTLLHILDYSQNYEFKDYYIGGEIPIDLSNLIIIISINSVDKLNKILLDRLQMIRFTSYSFEDKVSIGFDYIVPKVMKNLKIAPNDVVLSKKMIGYIINKSKIEEEGVRQLERNIRTIYERINTLIQIHGAQSSKKIQLSYDIPGFKTPFTLGKREIDTLFREFS